MRIPILFASDRAKCGHVTQSRLEKSTGKTAGVSGQNVSFLSKGDQKKKKKKYIYVLPFLSYFVHCLFRTENLKVLPPLYNEEEGQENYKERNPAPKCGRTAEMTFEPLTSRFPVARKR